MNSETQKLRNSGTPRSGFTIVELLMVVGIISVLVTITFSAVTGSMKRARSQKASALCMLVEQGIATYYAQKGEWPVEPGGLDGNSDVYTFTGSQVREMVKKVVEETKKNNPMMDVSGLFVSRDTRDPVAIECHCSATAHKRYVPAGGARGTDFMQAIHGTKRSSKKMKLSEMSFGYPHPGNGGFMRFNITYSGASDSVHVSQWHWSD